MVLLKIGKIVRIHRNDLSFSHVIRILIRSTLSLSLLLRTFHRFEHEITRCRQSYTHTITHYRTHTYTNTHLFYIFRHRLISCHFLWWFGGYVLCPRKMCLIPKVRMHAICSYNEYTSFLADIFGDKWN